MRFVIFGAGAIGGAVGCRLAACGEEVVLIARGAHAERIERAGLVLEEPTGRRTFQLPLWRSPADGSFREDDAVVLAMKSQDTHDAVLALRAVAPPTTPILCAQNGVDNERVALRYFPNVYGVVVMMPATHLEPGVVQANSTPTPGLLDVGRYPFGSDAVVERVTAALQRAGFSSLASDDIMRWKRAKLLMNLANALEAACGPAARGGGLARILRAEGVAVFEAAGLAFASPQEEAERRADRLQMKPIDGQRRGGGSTWQSLRRNAGSVEVDHLNGEILLLGRLHGVPTPANALVNRTVLTMVAEGTSPGTLDEAELLAEIAEERRREANWRSEREASELDAHNPDVQDEAQEWDSVISDGLG